ncbi:beta-1,6-galactofuranosyltransferase [Hyunsoonleella ulvae]|uniref:beta-1,6-galactofuranosyltransferase n=1 Tax=Hyunsoonleella ulvae TaxID=2799948 RepID=UPI00193AD32A|nr:beta-1,6-galactofuranosyltransferase [Hyunsoonleella ulvae]
MYYISRNYKSLFNAAGKAKTDCEFVFQKMGFKNLGFKQSSIPNSAIGTIKNFFGIFLALLKLPRKSTIITQYPNNKFRGMIMFFSKLKKCKIITVVHDVRILKGRTKDAATELKQIITSNVIIVHNPSMKQWFLEQGVTIPIVVLGIFDYVSEKKPMQNSNRVVNDTYSIAYAGGFGDGKNSYIFDFDILDNSNYDLRLYGIGFDPKKRKVEEHMSVVHYEGVFKSDEVAYKIESDFGLVWDGISTETCSGNYGAYLKFNNPHKTSLYLLCGMPVIIWDKAALAGFIKEHNVGITVSNLKDLNKILGDISAEDYKEMKQNVANIQTKVMEGYFVETAVNEALSIIQ